MSDPSRYYEYRPEVVEIGGRPISFFVRPSLGEWKGRATPALLLAEHLNVSPGALVLQLHCGTGLVGAAAALAASQGHVTLLDCHCVAVEAARRTLHENGVDNAHVALSDCGQAVLGQRFDTVVALLPKGRPTWEQTILDAACVLRAGGELCLAGANKGGIKSAARFVERVFGSVEVLGYQGGCRLLRAIRREGTTVPGSDYYAWRQLPAQVDGEQLDYVSKPGIFSWKQLDEGTRLLVEALQARPLQPDDHVLDIGCGSGVLTLVAAKQAPKGHVLGVDVDCRAVEATRRTLSSNGIANARALLSDCTEAVRDQSFSAVVTNPPFHQAQATTYAIAEQIIRDASGVLRRRGTLYLVANAFLRYQPIIEQAFGNVTLLRQTTRYKVWFAVKDR